MKSHYSHQVSFLVLISMLMLSAAAVYGAEESIVLTTYYPSPYGVYGEMRLYPKPSATCNSQQEGLMYYDNNAGKHVLRVCGGSPLGWQDIGGGFWAASPFNSNNIYNTNSGSVGIGTNNPAEKLDVTGRAHFSDVIKSGNLSVANNIMSVVGMTDVGGFAVGYNNGSGAIIGKNASLSGPGVGILDPGGVPAIGMAGGNPSYIEAYLGRDLQLKTATTNSVIYMKNSTGNVGIGTTSPNARLHVNGDIRIPYNAAIKFGNQDGFVDGGGGEQIRNTSTNGSGGFGLAFYAGGANRMVVSSNGYVGIGTTNPVVKLHVMGDMGCQFPGSGVYGDYFYVDQEGGRPVVRITDDGSYNPVLQFGKGSSWMNLEYYGSYLGIYGPTNTPVLISSIMVGGAYPGYSASWPYETIGMNPATNLRINFGSVQKYVFYNNGWAEAAAGGGWNVASDQRFKENVAELTDVLRALKNIRGVRFDWKRKDFPQKGFPEGRQIGFIAQEIEQEFPELVATNPEGYKSLDYGKLTPVLLQAIKEQQAEMESLKARIDKLEEKQAGLKTPG